MRIISFYRKFLLLQHLPALTVAVKDTGALPGDVVTFDIEEGLLIFKVFVVGRKIYGAFELDLDVLDIGDGDDRLHVVGGTFGEDDSTAGSTLLESGFNSFSSVAAGGDSAGGSEGRRGSEKNGKGSRDEAHFRWNGDGLMKFDSSTTRPF